MTQPAAICKSVVNSLILSISQNPMSGHRHKFRQPKHAGLCKSAFDSNDPRIKLWERACSFWKNQAPDGPHSVNR